MNPDMLGNDETNSITKGILSDCTTFAMNILITEVIMHKNVHFALMNDKFARHR